MQKDPYLVLGLSKGATLAEVESQYKALKEKYSNERFLEGEVGAEAAKKLSELEQAYKDCLSDINTANINEQFGTSFAPIENAIRAGSYDEAQRMLDDIDLRDAEWHYYQSMIYFKKGWHDESKSQLELCIALDPYNEKYNTALNKMKDYIKNQQPFSGQNANNNQQQQQQQRQQQTRAGYSDRQTNAENNANACCDTCCTLMCCDSCCECMGGDLIPCC